MKDMKKPNNLVDQIITSGFIFLAGTFITVEASERGAFGNYSLKNLHYFEKNGQGAKVVEIDTRYARNQFKIEYENEKSIEYVRHGQIVCDRGNIIIVEPHRAVIYEGTKEAQDIRVAGNLSDKMMIVSNPE